MSAIVLVVIITALIFDRTNAFHDTMATSIGTGALKPRVAVALAGVLTASWPVPWWSATAST